MTRAVLPPMQRADHGRIINTAPGSVFDPRGGLTVDAASEPAIIAFARASAAETELGVTANVVASGLAVAEHDMDFLPTRNLSSPNQGKPRALDDMVNRKIPIARKISFISSPEAEFVALLPLVQFCGSLILNQTKITRPLSSIFETSKSDADLQISSTSTGDRSKE